MIVQIFRDKLIVNFSCIFFFLSLSGESPRRIYRERVFIAPTVSYTANYKNSGQQDLGTTITQVFS